MLPRSLRSLVRRQAVVTLKTGEAFTGVLWHADREVVVLREAVAHQVTDRGTVPVDGELVVFRADVAYMQLP